MSATNIVKSPKPGLTQLAASLAAGILSACASSPSSSPGQDSAPSHVPVDPWTVPEPVPKFEPRSRYGNPDSYVVFGKRYHVRDSASGYKERGMASWYGTKFHGRRTSSGEPYDMFKITAAHKTLPVPAYVRVTNLENGRSLIVRVNDRGPFHPGRIIDLSYTAAVRLGVYAKGSARVEVEALEPGQAIAQVPQAAAEPQIEPASTAPDELESFLASLPNTPPGPKLPFLQIAAFRNMSQCTKLLDDLNSRRVLAVQVLEQGEDCLVVQGPFASVDDAQTQSGAVQALGHSPTIIYP